ncbi:ROK family protein [Luteimicrobium sp. NPDC057192]|uniref:ROK family protein n=1 Tax=Luteimicrobium sp. NPDC057192 TaxID=3346042 RepID=UPI00363878C8
MSISASFDETYAETIGDGEAEQRPGTFAVGLDIGGTKVLGVLLAADGTVVDSVRLPTIRGGDGVVRSASDVVRRLAAAADLDLREIGAVGVGVPGLVDPETGSVHHAVNLGIHADQFPLADRIAAELGGVPVHVDNDLNVAALGASFALGPDADDLAYLALGTGMAAGVVLGGELRRGASGAAGEVGHIPIRPDGPVCACGQRGCIELYASGSALARRWPTTSDVPAPLLVFQAAAAGDPRALEIRHDFAVALAECLRIIVLSYDVRRIVVGGGVTGVGAPLLDALREALTEQAATSPFLESLHIADRVTLAPSDVPIAAVGAALAGLRSE